MLQATVLSKVPRLPMDASDSEVGGDAVVVLACAAVLALLLVLLPVLLATDWICAFRLPIFCSSAAMICWPSGVLPDEQDVQSPN